MKHKTHTVEASGAGKDGTTDKIQTGTERPNEMERQGDEREAGKFIRRSKAGERISKSRKEQAGLVGS